MNVKEVRELIRRLRDALGQRALSLQCWCHNFETVYVLLDENDDVCVTDDHRTFQYLDSGTNSTYVPFETLDLVAVRRLCEELGVELRPAPPEGYPSIECVLDEENSVTEVVDRVSRAIDRVFDFALRKDLK